MNVTFQGQGCHGEIDDAVPDFVRKFVDDNSEKVSKVVEAMAFNSSAFKDQTGRLRMKIKAYKSKYPDGGSIVGAWASHAWVVEYGHDLIDWRTGRNLGHISGKKFLRTALDHGIQWAYNQFGCENK